MTESPPFEGETLNRIADFFGRRGVDAYVVGGTVRDWLLGRNSQDLDLAVAGDALELTRALADELHAAYVPLDEEHATARAVLRTPAGPLHYVDVTRLRGDTLKADLAHRDFTVNAMAIPLPDAAAGWLNLIDPLDGRGDLHAGRLRAVSASALRDDPLRLLRAVRLAAELNFTVESQTQRWIAELAPAVKAPSPERIRDELVRLLACPGSAGYLRRMDEWGLLAPLLPELVACQGVTQPPRHAWDVFEHSLAAVERLEWILGGLELSGGDVSGAGGALALIESRLAPFAERLRDHLAAELVGGRPRFVLLKLLTLLHDVGKPETRSVDEAGTIHFYEHERVGAEMVAAILRRLHFGVREVKIGRTVTFHHMRPMWLAQSEKVSSRAIYRFFRDTRSAGLDVVLLSLADVLAKSDAPAESDLEAQLDITDRLLEAWYQRRDRLVEPPALVRGGELIEALDLTPGPVVGEVLEAIREAQVTGEVSTRDEALAFAEGWIAENRSSPAGDDAATEA